MILLIGKRSQFRMTNDECRIERLKIRQSTLGNRHFLGMTLVEILVVLAIIGMLFSMGLPAVVRYAETVRLKATTRQLISLIALARSTAIAAHEDHTVRIQPDTHRIDIVNATSGQPLEPVVRLPASISVEMLVGGHPSQTTQFTFRATGSLVGQSVVLRVSDHRRTKTITVTSTTGSILVGEEQPEKA